jgi:actin-related protein
MTKSNSQEKTKRFSKYKPLFFGVAIFLLIILISIAITYAIYQTSHRGQETRIDSKIRSNEERGKRVDDQALVDKNYKGYQYSLHFYADNYFAQKDYNDTQEVLNRILGNVPKDQIQDGTYLRLSMLYKATKNKSKYEQYTQLLVEKLKQEGNNQDAVYYEKQL